MSAGWIVAEVLREPRRALDLDAAALTELLCAARALTLIGTLAERLQGMDLDHGVQRVLADVRASSEAGQRQALWEADCARRALADYDGKVVLMKGTAYVSAGLAAREGRQIGDLDIMVARDDLPAVEPMLLAAGWEWVKPDPYDDAYYRRWMHELPPLIHRERDRMIDVHHTILPPTAQPKPDAAALLEDARRLDNGLWVFSPADMICHAVAHLIADGELAGGMRNLWDIDRLVRQFAQTEPDFWSRLGRRAARHALSRHVGQALRLANALYETPVDAKLAGPSKAIDRLFLARVTAVNGWGQKTRKNLRRAFFLRSHLIRMPFPMLARHLFIKWRKGHRAQAF